MYFDTLTVAQNLMKADMPAPQAEAIAREYANLMQHQIDQFATKEDLKHLESRLEAKIEAQCNQVDKKADIRFNTLDKKIDEKFNILDKRMDRLEAKLEILETKVEGLFLRLTVTMGSMFVTTTGLLFAAMKLFM
jgi:predicted nuclease with TOPRIM domain